MVTEATTSNDPLRMDRRALRREETKAEIIAAAWDVVREHGLAGLAMRELGERVGMKAQSIYSYFESKHEIYDAMFHEGYLAFAAATTGPQEAPAGDGPVPDRRDQALAMSRKFFEFCTSDPVRYQLLFQRTIPEFVPSAASYAVAVECYESMAVRLSELGATDPGAVDLWTAMLTGLTDQQISNDPGGTRWEQLLERAVDMLLREIAPASENPPRNGTPS